MDRLSQMLIQHEGMRLKPYRCTAGKITIGVGHNLDDLGITEEQALMIFRDDLANAYRTAKAVVPKFLGLSEARQAVLVDMAFNLGETRLRGFRKMLSAIEHGQYRIAADEMLDSKWASQVHGRAERLARMMRTGEWEA